jgi:ATP-binding cassette, subfamily B, bacterial
MGFIMDGLGEEEYDRSYSDRALVRRITGYFRPQLPRMIGVAVLIVLNSAVDTTLPLLLSGGIDTLGRTREMSTAWLLVAAILVAGGLSWTFNFFRQWNTAQVVGDVVLKLRRDAFHAVLGHDMSFYDENSSGKIISRVTSDTDAFATVVTLTLNLLSQVLLVILIIGVLFSISPPLTLATLTIAPLIVLIALGFRRVAREWITRAQRVGGRVNATVQEAISGITVAKNFRQEATMYGEFRKVNAQAYQVNVRTGLVFSGVFPLLGVAAGIGSTLVVYFGGLQALDGHISPGTWFLFVQSINLFWFPLTGIASF